MDNQHCTGQEELADLIIKETCRFYEMEPEDIMVVSRKRQIVKPRQIATYLVLENTHLSLKQIGKKVGGKDHSTVLYSKETVLDLLKTDKYYRHEVLTIEQNIKRAIFES